MIGLLIAVAVIAAVTFALLRYHPTMRYPAYVIDHDGRRYMIRPGAVKVWTRKQRNYYAQMALYGQVYERERRFRTELLIAERFGMSVVKPENIVKIVVT